MTTPPPPPGGGGNQPYDPSASNTGAGSTPGQGSAPDYGSAPGQPPQAPPPAPGGSPQGGGDAGKAKNLSIASIVLGVIGCCCWPLAIGGVEMQRRLHTTRGLVCTAGSVPMHRAK